MSLSIKDKPKLTLIMVVAGGLAVILIIILWLVNQQASEINQPPVTSQAASDSNHNDRTGELDLPDTDPQTHHLPGNNQASPPNQTTSLPPQWSQWSKQQRTAYLRHLEPAEQQAVWNSLEHPLAFWQSLALDEQLLFNPYQCPSIDGVIRLQAHNGQCLSDSSDYQASHNPLNLNVIARQQSLWVIYDGGPQTASLEGSEIEQTGGHLAIRAFRVSTAADCRPTMSIPGANDYARLPYASQHWQGRYIFDVGFYDIGKTICLYAWEAPSYQSHLTNPDPSLDTIYTQALRVQNFQAEPWQIKFDMYHQGQLLVSAETYLITDQPAWEYILIPATMQTAGCRASTFAEPPATVISQTFETPQHFFHTYDTGFQYHDAGAAVQLSIDLTEADIGKLLCNRVRDSFGTVVYDSLVIPASLQMPRMVT